MKLAFCLFNYFPYGGLQRDFLRIANLCLARGHEVTIFTMRLSGEVDERFNIRLIKVNDWQNHTRIRSFVKKLKQELLKEPFDLVVGFDRMPYLDIYYAADRCYAGRIATRKFVSTYLTLRYWQLRNMERRVFAYGLPTKILLLSPREKAIIQSYYQTEDHRFVLLPPNLDKNNIAPKNAATIRTQIRKKLKLKEHDYMLLLVGSSFKTKGVKRAIKALARLKALRQQSHLYIIGQDDASDYKELAKKLNIDDRVIFLGSCDHVRDYMLAADILLHPAHHENTGTVLLEAAVAGLPVLTLDHCGYAHYIANSDLGMVLPTPFNLKKFSAALLSMLQQPLKRKNWHNNGIQFAKNEDLYLLPQQVVNVIEQTAMSKKQNAWLQNISYCADEIKEFFPKDMPLFEQMMQLEGEVYRCKEGRLTKRIMLGGRSFFIKQHFGVGKKEIWKNWLQFRSPVTSAKNEWQAIHKLQQVGVATAKIVCYGMRGTASSQLESFILMEEIQPAVSLEQLITTPRLTFKMKRELTHKIANIAAALHENGINHRDFYLCHLLLNEEDTLFLIDLHRAEIRTRTPSRWMIKDLASLYFSCKGIKLSTRDLYRFIKSYRRSTLHNILTREVKFWQKVKHRGENYRDHTQ